MLTPFSQRYNSGDAQQPAGEAAMASGGQVILAPDLNRIPVPPRLPPAASPGHPGPGGTIPNGDRMPVRVRLGLHFG
jgi:hypothetical protein